MTTTHFRTAAPTCPHCNHEMDDDEMLADPAELFAAAPDESQHEITCPACDQAFHLRGGYTPFYTTAIDEDDL